MRTTKIDVRFNFVSCRGISFLFFLFRRVLVVVSTSLFLFFVLVGRGGGGFCFPTSCNLFFYMCALSPVEVNLPLCLTSWSFPSPLPLCWFRPLSPLLLPFPMWPFKLLFRLGPLFPFVARVGPNVCPMFQMWYVSILVALSRFLGCFLR